MQGHTQRIDTRLDDPGHKADSPKTIGKYEIVEPIGEGGFGMVYKGFDPFIKRHVAIKTCTSPDKELRQRYFREAEIAGRLDHPNIVRIFDFGTENETPFLVQEFLAGEDLDHKIGGRQFVPFPERLLYLIHIARGLAYAHEQGVIHRDIKPANIRVLEDGSAKIMDFGVAMLQNTETRLTKDGMAVGTAAYLAPEQVKGKTVDNRSDIFSYGVLAYEILTGLRPFERDTISATLFSILHDDPKPITLPTHVCPDSLRRLIETCIAKEADLRPEHFGHVLETLDDIRAEMRVAEPDRDLAGELRNVSSTPTPTQRSKSFDPPIHHEWTPPSIHLQRRRRRLTLLIPAVILAILATSYVVLANQGLVPWLGEELPDLTSIATSTAPPEIEEEPPREEATEPQIPTEQIEESSPDPSAASVTIQEAPLETGQAVEPVEVAEPEPPPPPVVEKAILRLAQGWHQAMTASINGGASLALTRSRTVELEPGDYSVRFSLQTPDYSSNRTVSISLGSGEDRTVRNPIGRPGHLSVQASLGSPQGVVRVDGLSIGSSPVRGHLLSPGKHQLQVFSVNDANLPLARTDVDIRSGRETVITFDLTGQREMAVRYRDLQP